MIKGVHHVQITIPKGEEEAGRAFYCEELGIEEMEKPASLQGRGGFWLKLGHRQVHVGTEEGLDRLQTKAHIAYEVTDLDYWKQRLNMLGIEIIESVPIPGYERFECRDPFGNRMEFIKENEK
ncbi:VOC family protein [Alkalihalobacillus hemicellulosilyticus]|uniref:Glyoxalase n=1 Tax=Halalkalibacter hemicellulosilyticusJCM 9152 TaxID=1236971 RepID=W4QLH2_9BACI|nr:VOC family protein [Halalkalibacter hemicellulosilyticus]GAE32209.1 glyoxalase [Halalkalibacter hemicellulosilyticusJCM 9152]